MQRELVVCYRSCVDGAWVPFQHFSRRELAIALASVRRLAHGRALRSPWILKRGKKTILRMPEPRWPQ
jgi:hypothetical protein